MTKEKTKPLKQLGHPTRLPSSPEAALLERVPNPHPDADYVARFTMPEFTTLCPVTGQPDFAHFVIDYVPDEFLVDRNRLSSISIHSGTPRAFMRAVR